MIKLVINNNQLLEDAFLQLAVLTGEIDLVDEGTPDSYEVSLNGDTVHVRKDNEVFDFPWPGCVTDDLAKYDGIIKHSNRPYAIAYLGKNNTLRDFIAQYARTNHVSVVLDCPEEDVLAILQQSRLSLTTKDSSLMWASLAQGCTTFVNDQPEGLENHIHYVTYDLNDLHLLAFNVNRFLSDSRHAEQIGISGNTLALQKHTLVERCKMLVEKIKGLSSTAVAVFSGEVIHESDNSVVQSSESIGSTSEIIGEELATE